MTACLAALLAAALLAVIAPAAAQGPAPGTEAELDALFEELLQDPGNLDLTFRYAEAATRAGNYEAAITALERMLLFRPDLPRVQLELGVLYFRLGSYTAARGYLERVAARADTPPEVKTRVAEFLAEIERRESRHAFGGSALIGLQYQTNPSAAANDGRVRALGFDATLGSEFARRPDWSGVLSASALYSYDLATQAHDTFEVTGSLFASEYARTKRLDLTLVELAAGPRLRLGGLGLPDSTLRPYVLGNHVRLGNAPYFHTYGGGVEATHALTADLTLRASYERRQKNFDSSSERTTARELTGGDNLVALSLLQGIGRTGLLTVSLGFVDQNTRTAATSNVDYGGTVSYQLLYAAPFGWGLPPWQATVSAGRFIGDYEAPDPLVDPGVTRFDQRWRLGVANVFALTTDIGLVLQVQYEDVDSSLPNFAYTNTAVLLGPQIRF